MERDTLLRDLRRALNKAIDLLDEYEVPEGTIRGTLEEKITAALFTQYPATVHYNDIATWIKAKPSSTRTIVQVLIAKNVAVRTNRKGYFKMADVAYDRLKSEGFSLRVGPKPISENVETLAEDADPMPADAPADAAPLSEEDSAWVDAETRPWRGEDQPEVEEPVQNPVPAEDSDVDPLDAIITSKG